MRLAFLGLPLAALLLHADGNEILVAGLRRGLTLGKRRLKRVLGEDRLVLDPHQDWDAFVTRLHQFSPDLLVSWFFTQRIPIQVMKACKLGGIGVHPSLLPRHRGPDPFYWAIETGDRISGVTVHSLDEQYDTGDIVAQRAISIDPSWNAWDLARALDRPSLALLRDVVGRLHTGESLARIPQDSSLATQAPFPRWEERVLGWNRPAVDVVRRVRALAPHPGAVVFFGDWMMVVQQAEVRPVYKVLVPGEVAVIDGIAVVKAKDQGVALLCVEVEGQLWDAATIAQTITQTIAQQVASNAKKSANVGPGA